MASIIIIAGASEGDYFPLGRRNHIIGRDNALTIQITDEHISRKHLHISFDEQTQRYNVNDLKSKHGTFVNGRKINEETELREGDKIDIGKTTLLFSLKDFDDRKTAFDHSKKAGQRFRETMHE